MKVIIREEVHCDNNNMKKYLPAQYLPLVNKNFYNKTVALVCFPADKSAITSSCIVKARKKIKNTNADILYFAHCFTMEAIKLIQESNGSALSVIEFPWTDERYNQIHGGTR